MSLRRRTFGAPLGCFALAAACATTGCVAEEASPEEAADTVEQSTTGRDTATFPAHYARQWMTNLANSCKGDKIHPVVAARTYSYGAIAVYESLVHGMPGYRSLAGQVNGLDRLPKPASGKVYDWPTVLAQTMHVVVNGNGGPNAGLYVYPNRLFFEYTTLTQASLTSLGPTQIGYRKAAGVTPQVMANSTDYGTQLGNALLQWISTDGYGEVRFKGWVEPTGPDKWVPTGFSDADKVANPEEPYFGTVRPIVLRRPEECTANGPPPFSTAPGSTFHTAAMAVYDAERNQTDEEREIAAFWADVPGPSAAPPGHWLALASKYVRSGTLADAAVGYGMGLLTVHDAAVVVWYDKYKYNLLRPETYIRRHIDPNWQATWPAPKFPAYTSGHSGFSGAASVMLKAAFGESAPIVDDTKVRRGFAPRTFPTWAAAAEEAADSRLFGGIHYPFDNADGLTSGRCISNKALQRVRFR